MLLSAPTQPTVIGHLHAASIAELLVTALTRQLTGSLVLETPAHEKSAIVLRAGHVIKLRTATLMEPLGGLLLAGGLVDAATLATGLLRARQEKVRLGASLLSMKAVRAEHLEAMLGEQLARRISWLSRLPSTSAFGFYADVDWLAEQPESAADPWALIWRSVRDALELQPRQRALLAGLESQPLRVTASAQVDRLGLNAAEQALVQGLREHTESLPLSLRRATLDPDRLERLLYVLVLTGQLESALAPDPAPEAWRGLEPMSHLTRQKPHAEQASAEPTPAPVRALEDRIEQALDRATRARRVQERAKHALEATRAFQAAEECVRRQQFERAQDFARQASEADAMNAEYLALHAWLRMHGGELSQPAAAAQILAALDRAVSKERSNTRIRFYRAQVLKQLGRHEDAFKDFRFVARQEPSHLDALREVRLHLMRSRKRQKSSGVFSRLFLR
jgi:tetratricopeptide (TPR) repeat protein